MYCALAANAGLEAWELVLGQTEGGGVSRRGGSLSADAARLRRRSAQRRLSSDRQQSSGRPAVWSC